MTPRPAIAIVGAGPRGTGVLERIRASAPELLGGSALDVHLVDPFPAGAGRIWRHEQSPLLAMNSMAADVTMFTDASVVCEGPVRPGPSMWEWAQALRAGELPGADRADLGPALGAELDTLTAATFPSRQLQSGYLGWVLRHVVAGLPPGFRVHVHRTRATRLTEEGGRQVVALEQGGALRVDAVVLASGHLDATPTEDEQALSARATAHGLRYLPPEQTTDSDLSVIEPGEDVLVRGTGLAFVDLAVLLYEGRGGRYVETPDGLRYLPSGNEPVLHVGSPRGALYHAKTAYALRAGRPPLPRFLGPDVVDPLIAEGSIELADRVWPLMAKEIAWGWYHELVVGHPDRVELAWPEFATRYADLGWGTPEMEALLAVTATDPVDRIDLASLDRPLDGITAPDEDALQPLVRAVIAEDLRQHTDPRHTPHLGAFVAMLSVYGEVGRLTESLSARSRARDLGRWQSFFNAVASGPPGFRVRQILALSEAGFLRFLGAGAWFEVREGAFHGGSAALVGAPPVTARVLVDARLPDPSASRSLDPLLADLVRLGGVVEDVLRDGDGAVLGNTGLVRTRSSDGALLRADGSVHPARFAVGPHTSVKVAGAFTRPGMNAQSLRYNDAVARAVLRALPVAAAAAA